MSREYKKWKRKPEKQRKISCRTVRDRGRSHYRKLDKLPGNSICSWAKTEAAKPLAAGNRRIIRRKIVKAATSGRYPLFSKPDFPISELKSNSLLKLYYLIDKHFLDGEFASKIRKVTQKMKRPVRFAVDTKLCSYDPKATADHQSILNVATQKRRSLITFYKPLWAGDGIGIQNN